MKALPSSIENLLVFNSKLHSFFWRFPGHLLKIPWPSIEYHMVFCYWCLQDLLLEVSRSSIKCLTIFYRRPHDLLLKKLSTSIEDLWSSIQDFMTSFWKLKLKKESRPRIHKGFYVKNVRLPSSIPKKVVSLWNTYFCLCYIFL